MSILDIPRELLDIIISFASDCDIQIALIYQSSMIFQDLLSKKQLILDDNDLSVLTIPLLKWVHSCERPLSHQLRYRACSLGDLDLIKWISSSSSLYCYQWEEDAITLAAQSGHLEVIKWLREKNGCKWNSDAVIEAAQNGYLEIVKWLLTNGCPWSPSVFHQACTAGQLAVAKWLSDNKYKAHWDCNPIANTALCGHLEVVKWLREECECEWTSICVLWAVEGTGESTSTVAGKTRHLEVTQWLVNNGCPWDKNKVIERATKKGNYEIAQWLSNQPPYQDVLRLNPRQRLL